MQPTYRGDGTPELTGSLFLRHELPGPRSSDSIAGVFIPVEGGCGGIDAGFLHRPNRAKGIARATSTVLAWSWN